MKVCLFGLTGFGNSTLNGLINLPFVTDILVITRKEKHRFPYYDCISLEEMCVQRNINVCFNQELNSDECHRKIVNFLPEIILVATFHQRIPQRIIDIPRMGAVNIHPSLLPAYRGPTPTNWVIINGESETGITFHFVTDEFDMGDILYQKKVSIDGLSDGKLREKLAGVAGAEVGKFLWKYMNNRLEPKRQNKKEGSYFPNVRSRKGIAMLKSGHYNREDVIRGLTPFPGVGILE